MPDLLTMVNMARYGEAETMLRDDPSRIGPDGGDTIALHVSVSKRKPGHHSLAAGAWHRTSTPSGGCGISITPHST